MATEDLLLRLWPGADERTQVRWARAFTAAIGAVTWALSLVTDRAIFDLGVWCFSGFTGLVPIVLAALYWRRATAAGCVAAVLAVVVSWTALFLTTGEGGLVGGVMPVTWIVLASGCALVGVSLATRPPPDEVLIRFFPEAA